MFCIWGMLMFSGINHGSRFTVVAVFLVAVFLLPTVSIAVSTDPTVQLDYGLDLYDDQRYKNTETALINLVNSSSFRRLDNSQKALAYSHIAYSKLNRGKEKQSLPYIEKALVVTKREFGERSLPYVNHLRTKALAFYWSNNRRKAVRTGESILKIIERMDGDYRDEQAEIRYMIAQMRKVNLEEDEIPKDLSDFYTACESINSTRYLAKVDSIMHKYTLIGKDFKPDYKQSRFFKNTYLQHARESSTERRSRIIYVPDAEHLKDWCVVYPDKKFVSRVVISASDDR